MGLLTFINVQFDMTANKQTSLFVWKSIIFDTTPWHYAVYGFFSFMITFRLTLLTVFTMRRSAWKQTKHSTRKKNTEKHSFSFVRLVTEGPWLSEDERMTVSESEVPHLATPMAPMTPTQSKACSNEYGVHPWVWSSCINHHKVLTNKENLYI